MTYKDLVKKVIADTPSADFRDSVSKDKTVGKILIQYQETDWQFVKRLASHFHTGLIPDLTTDKPKFYFGLPEGNPKEKLENYNYSVHKRLREYRDAAENYISGLNEHDFIVYEVESGQILEVGNEVEFNNKKLYVMEAVTEMQESIIKNI